MVTKLPRHLRAQLVLSALNFKYGPQGWRIFASDRGRLWAVTTSAGYVKRYGCLADSVDADTPAQLAAKLRTR